MNGNERKQNQFQEKVVDKSTVEAAWAGIPELSLSPGSTKDEPVLIDKRYYNREYKVKDGEIYTIRLELLHGSAALECNNGSGRIPLSGEAVNLKDDEIVISQGKLKTALPDYYTYIYDFITFQVRTVVEDECLLTEEVTVEDDNSDWGDYTEAKVGDRLKFWISYVNNSAHPQENITIALKFPQSLKFLSGSVELDGCGAVGGEDLFKITDPGNIQIKHCDPGGEVFIDCRAEVADILPEGETSVWKWTEVRVDQKIVQNYSEVIVKK